MLSLSFGAPLLPGLPLSCLSQYHSGPISHDFMYPGASGTALLTVGEQIVSPGCFLAGGALLGFAAVSLHLPLELCSTSPHPWPLNAPNCISMPP